MNLDDIKQVLDLVREHDLAELEIEKDGLKVRVRKASAHVALQPAAVPMAALPQAAPVAASTPVAAPAPSSSAPAVTPAEESGVDLAVIKSPIVGTFYRQPEPGAPSFVEKGDRVKKGQVLCIIEAMKLMNEIESETEGELAAIYVENGQPVQYGDRLFAIKISS